jgi:hypothetical protein
MLLAIRADTQNIPGGAKSRFWRIEVSCCQIDIRSDVARVLDNDRGARNIRQPLRIAQEFEFDFGSLRGSMDIIGGLKIIDDLPLRRQCHVGNITLIFKVLRQACQSRIRSH